MIKLLAIGDVMGKAGRRSLAKLLPLARERFSPDIVLANGENAAGGFGLTHKIYRQLTETMGIDCITMGNHWADKREILNFMTTAERLVLPANMTNVDDETKGCVLLQTTSGVQFAVINLSGCAFMAAGNRNLFMTVDRLLDQVPHNIKIRVIDVHAEATSEKQGLGQYLAGRVSLVYGTHSHVPTADERILKGKTGYTTDLGMTGPYDSVIGIRTEAALGRMLTGERKNFEPATDDLWMCFVVAEVDPGSGECRRIERHRWRLDEQLPAAGPT